MDNITLTFPNPINVSLQAGSGLGDIVYYQRGSNIVRMGECTAVSGNTLSCNIDPSTDRPIAGDFIFFAKDSTINTSGIIGYYAEVKMEITPDSNEELFAVSSEVFISS
jgi:hypothetical protein